MSAKKVHIIFNPASAGGRTWKRRKLILKEIRKCWNDFIIEYTGKPGDAVSKTRHAVASGRDLIVAVGGDGTIREVVNGFYNEGKMINPGCTFAVINSGTGQGFAQSLGLPKRIKDQFKVILDGNVEKTDIGRITSASGACSYFANEFQSGIGGQVVKSVSHFHKKFTRRFAFGFGVLKVIGSYNPSPYTLRLNDNLDIYEELTGIVISNGKYTGGGMKLNPGAELNDGYLDILLIPGLTFKEMLLVFPKIYSGRHLKDKRFKSFKVKSITIDSSKSVISEADGEIINGLPLHIDIVPSSLNVIRPERKES